MGRVDLDFEGVVDFNILPWTESELENMNIEKSRKWKTMQSQMLAEKKFLVTLI